MATSLFGIVQEPIWLQRLDGIMLTAWQDTVDITLHDTTCDPHINPSEDSSAYPELMFRNPSQEISLSAAQTLCV